MTDKKDIPAFPHQKEYGSPYWGMTLRDYFASKALANPYTEHDQYPDKIAEWAYQVADAMIAARDK